MIWDCFTFNKELELLDLRFRELDSVIDRWVLVEMNVTHTGKPKPFHFDRNRHKFRKWLPRIEHVKVYDSPPSLDPFQRERHQRNAIQRGLRIPQDNDIVTLGDADEIPRPNSYEHFRKTHWQAGVAILNMRLYHYWLNGFVNEPWLMPKIMTGWFYKRSVPEEIRYWHYHETPVPIIQDAGWHFSWIGGIGACIEKFDSIAPVIFPGSSETRDELTKKRFPNPTDYNGINKVVPVTIDDSWPSNVLSRLPHYKSMNMVANVSVT